MSHELGLWRRRRRGRRLEGRTDQRQTGVGLSNDRRGPLTHAALPTQLLPFQPPSPQRLPLSGPFSMLSPWPLTFSVRVLPTTASKMLGREGEGVDSKRQRKAWHRISAQLNKD